MPAAPVGPANVYHSSGTRGKFAYRREPGMFVLYIHDGIGPDAV